MSVSEPITLSAALGINSAAISAVGAIDVSLNCDTNLFIDPLLLGEAGNVEFRDCAIATYSARFEQIIALLAASKTNDDVAWRAAKNKLKFHEISFTHLGYSASTAGSGFGKSLTDGLIGTAKEVVDLGVADPDLFIALALFEGGVGADRISDMTTNIVLGCLAQFTLAAAQQLGIPTATYKIGHSFFELPTNPLKDEPLLFVPKDIVRDLPIAADWDSVASASSQTEELRQRVNEQIGEIWAAKTKKQKGEILQGALRSKQSFETLIDLIRRAADEPYDLKNDHRGEIYPSEIRKQVAAAEPLDLSKFSQRSLTIDEADHVVRVIIDKFKSLVEEKGLWKEFWNDGGTKARLEKAMQRLFFAVASAYCEANNLDLSPESDAGCGPVDFKMSSGAKAKVVVELKRSLNPRLLSGYLNQLATYKTAEGAMRGHYVVIDVGALTSQKVTQLTTARNEALKLDAQASEISYIDGNVQLSASKR